MFEVWVKECLDTNKYAVSCYESFDNIEDAQKYIDTYHNDDAFIV